MTNYANRYRFDLRAAEFPADVIIKSAKQYLCDLHRLRKDAPDRWDAIADVKDFLREQGVSEQWLVGAEKAALRPSDYMMLDVREQWAIDKDLGILDWEGV